MIDPLKWSDKDIPLLSHTIKEYQPLINRIDPKQIEAMKMSAQQEIDQAVAKNQPEIAAEKAKLKQILLALKNLPKLTYVLPKS